MSLGEWLRLLTLIFSFPNTAMVVAFGIHLWYSSQGPDQVMYRPVFRAATIFYLGAGIVIGTVSIAQVIHFNAPVSWILPFVLIGHLVVFIGMLGQFQQLPRRKW